jgi:hypothetical protein
MDQDVLEALTLEAVQAYQEDGASFDIEKIAFPKQLEFIQDPWRLKTLFCTRRAAKSYTGGLYLVKEALEYDNCNCLYIGLTRQSAKGIIWKDVLKDINKKNNLEMSFNGSELTATTRNGSIIYVTGADADEDEMEKLLGKKYRLVIIDEAASFTIDLRRLIYGILKPATVDQGGSICLLGTSGNLTSGLFFDITTNKEQGWKLFEWSAFDNPHIAQKWQEELDDIKLNRPLFMETPLFKQWYLNEWVIDLEQLVYRFSYGRNDYFQLPFYSVRHSSNATWQYVLGVDLGYDPDPSAFVVVAFHEYDPNLYILTCFKQTEMDVTDVANKIKWFKKEYGIDRVVIDGANKQAVMEIQKRHDVGLTTADKTGKVDFIQIMNAEMIQGKIKLSAECQELKDEYLNLIWDPKSLKKQEHPNCSNHLTDAALYAWRFCYQFLSQMPKQQPNLKDKKQYVEHTQKLMEEALEKQIQYEQSQERETDIWNLSGLDEEDQMSYYVNKRRA